MLEIDAVGNKIVHVAERYIAHQFGKRGESTHGDTRCQLVDKRSQTHAQQGVFVQYGKFGFCFHGAKVENKFHR